MILASATSAASPTGALPANMKGHHFLVVRRCLRCASAAAARRTGLTGRATGGSGRKKRDGHPEAPTAPQAWVTKTDMEAGHGIQQAGKAGGETAADVSGA